MPERTPGTVRLGAAGAEAAAVGILRAAGATAEHAAIVVTHLIEADRMGLHSHGLSRIAQYVDEIGTGVIDPVAEPHIERTAPSRLAIDGRRGFGQVVGMRMVEALAPVAHETGLAMASGRHLGHTGRVGAYPQALAGHGLVGLAACNGAPSGHWVAPFAGREGRISTNPIAFAWPVEDEDPVIGDFSTGATAEGVVRGIRDAGARAPDGALQDALGRPTTDPGVLYDDPRGAIRPLGGALGYRGTALALLVEILTTALNGDRVADGSRRGTDMTLVAIAPDDGFERLAADLSAHIRSTEPTDPERPVLMPGDREHALRSRRADLELPEASFRSLTAAARAADVAPPGPITNVG